jgi:hypothetical protein
VRGGAALEALSDRMLGELRRRVAPALTGLVMGDDVGTGNLCFFAVENSMGYAGDASIRQVWHW